MKSIYNIFLIRTFITAIVLFFMFSELNHQYSIIDMISKSRVLSNTGLWIETVFWLLYFLSTGNINSKHKDY